MGIKARKRLEKGDLVAVHVKGEPAMVCYLGACDGLGATVAVLGQVSLAGISPASVEEAVVVFYPLQRAVNVGLASVVGRLTAGIPELPRLLRQPGLHLVDGRPDRWIIFERGNRRNRRVVTTLSPDEARIPDSAILTHQGFEKIIERGWEA